MYNYCSYSKCSPLRTNLVSQILELCSILGPTDAKSHSLTSKECTRLAFKGGKAENQQRPMYKFGEGRVADKQLLKTSAVQPVHGSSQCVTHAP